MFRTTPQRVLYWIQKFFCPNFHPKSHGGHHWQKFNNAISNSIWIALWDILQQFPLGTIPFFVKKLQSLDFNVSYDDVRKIFASWNWSWKIPGVQQLLKYTPANIEYYFTFAVFIQYIPLMKMKWLDEAHIMPSHLLKGMTFFLSLRT